jgi:hypothetical protein
MAWAVFNREFNWRRPRSIYSFNAKPSSEPQSRVHDFVEAAVAAGAAVRCQPPTADTTPKRRRRTNP